MTQLLRALQSTVGDEMFDNFPEFDETLRHMSFANISQILYCKICQNSNSADANMNDKSEGKKPFNVIYLIKQ